SLQVRTANPRSGCKRDRSPGQCSGMTLGRAWAETRSRLESSRQLGADLLDPGDADGVSLLLVQRLRFGERVERDLPFAGSGKYDGQIVQRVGSDFEPVGRCSEFDRLARETLRVDELSAAGQQLRAHLPNEHLRDHIIGCAI